MRLFKLAAISIAVLFFIVTFIGLLLPSKVIVSRTVEIHQNPENIFTYTRDLNGWQQWVKGLQNQKIETPTKTAIGHSTIIIDSVVSNIVYGRWIEANGATQNTMLQLIAKDNMTIVNWQFSQVVAWYPWKRFSSMLNEKVIGGMMEENLALLIKLAEK